MCVRIILTHLTSLDGRRFDGVLCRDARFKYGHRGIVIDAEEEGDRETFFSGQVGGAVQSRFEDAIGPAHTTLVGSIIEPKRTGSRVVLPEGEEIANIDDECVLDRRRSDPLAVRVQHLEGWDCVLRKNGEAFVVLPQYFL
jgi:hypothetical protein